MTGSTRRTRFADPRYVGDPINAVRVFNEKEVDELVLLDIEATPTEKPLDVEVIADIVSEAFMPVCYGGGVRSLDDFDRAFAAGVEKVSINTAAATDSDLIDAAAARYGSQSVVVSIDVQQGRRRREVRVGGGEKAHLDPVSWAKECEGRGAGELLLTSVDRDGTREGYDLELIREVASAVDIPVVACGGAGTVEHLAHAFAAGANAAAAGSMFVFHGPRRAVLISYLTAEERLSLV